MVMNIILKKHTTVPWEGCCAATILLYSAPTGQDARGGDPNASSLQ